MKKYVYAALMLASGLAFGQKSEDIKSIKAMAGCYEVEFNFAETFPHQKDYEKKKNYRSGGLEWVGIAEERPDKIVLQHILVVDTTGAGKDAVVKHWRQDWLYQNTDLYTFHKDVTWKYKKLQPADVQGQWTQNVYQVDDSPRYAGTGTWIHKDGRNYWEANVDAPLPRREYTTRKDYNVLNRNNRQEIMSWGWLHNQDNNKVLRTDGQADQIIVEEKGKEYYRRVADSKCKIAKDYWQEYAPLWTGVRQAWDEVLARKKDLTLMPMKRDTDLYSILFDLQPGQVKEAKESVKKFIKQ